jgi:hypothetical protein
MGSRLAPAILLVFLSVCSWAPGRDSAPRDQPRERTGADQAASEPHGVGPTADPPDPAVSCADKHADDVDVDGDGRPDRVYLTSVRSGSWIGVCTASGIRDQRFLSGNDPGFLYPADIGPGRKVELVAGGTSAHSAIAAFHTLHEGRLVEILGPGDRGLLFEYGQGPESAMAWGCRDEDGDGRREVIQVRARWLKDDPGSWTRIAYRPEGIRFVKVSERSGIFGPASYEDRLSMTEESVGLLECVDS